MPCPPDAPVARPYSLNHLCGTPLHLARSHILGGLVQVSLDAVHRLIQR